MTRMRNKRREKLPEGDDGRVIASMNVEGMPWYKPEPPKEVKDFQKDGVDVLSRAEARMYTWGAMKAALLVAGVMCVGLVLFVLFCLYVWFPH